MTVVGDIIGAVMLGSVVITCMIGMGCACANLISATIRDCKRNKNRKEYY